MKIHLYPQLVLTLVDLLSISLFIQTEIFYDRFCAQIGQGCVKFKLIWHLFLLLKFALIVI